MKVSPSLCISLICVFFSVAGQAADLCVECELEQLQSNPTDETVKQSIKRLKKLLDTDPDNRALVLLLATAYAANGNEYWALNVLYSFLENHPNDCEVKSFAIWHQLIQGNIDTAKELLEQTGCPTDKTMETRWQLLSQYLLFLESPTKIEIKAMSVAYPEDREMWDMLWNSRAHGREIPIELRVAMEGGYTTNGQAGSPLESVARQQDSAIGSMELQGRLIIPTRRWARPAMDVASRFHGLSASPLQQYSYTDLSIKPGIILGRNTQLKVAYKGNLLLMAMKGQKKFYESHRLELEIRMNQGVMFFAGTGKRFFKQNGRTRNELDGGIAATKRLNNWLFLMAAVHGKYYNAVGKPYDQISVGLILTSQIRLPASMSFRSGVSVTHDNYLNSGGNLGSIAFGTTHKRKDFTVRSFGELWSPSLSNFKAGIRYELNHRDSSADLESGSFDYDYLEHKFLFKLSVSRKIHPAAPRLTRTNDHVPLNYGIDKNDNAADNTSEEIAEILRQDEAARAASSCVEK